MNNYKATPEQWIDVEFCDKADFNSACILELRVRIETLEAAQQPYQDKLDRLIALDRDDFTEDAAQQPPLFTAEEVARIVAPTFPDNSLIDRVSKALYDAPNTHEGWRSEARAAILEVARWLRENECDYNAVRWLEQEAGR
jgi:hypothetical protein